MEPIEFRGTFFSSRIDGDPASMKYRASTIPGVKSSGVTLSTTSYVYSGDVRTPGVTVKDINGQKLVKNVDYKVSYATGRKKVGTYNVTIKGIGDYSFNITKSFDIRPQATAISSLTAGSNSFTVKWQKRYPQVDGYRITYSTSSKFSASTTKRAHISSYKTTTKKLTKLKGGKKYYVKIESYKIANSKYYYSKPSKVKTVTTKK